MISTDNQTVAIVNVSDCDYGPKGLMHAHVLYQGASYGAYFVPELAGHRNLCRMDASYFLLAQTDEDTITRAVREALAQ